MNRTLTSLLLIAACFVAYWAWLGWDTTYQRDPRTGQLSGPYETWQVAGCVLTLGVAAAVAGARRQVSTAVLVMPAAFTTAWALAASRLDDSGLWLVGAFMVFVGMTLCVPFVAGAARLVTNRDRSVRPRGGRALRGRRATRTR